MKPLCIAFALALVGLGCIDTNITSGSNSANASNGAMDMGSDLREPSDDLGEADAGPDLSDDVGQDARSDLPPEPVFTIVMNTRVEAMTEGTIAIKRDEEEVEVGDNVPTSSDESVLSIDGLTWTAHKPGSVTVSFAMDGSQAELEVEVVFEILDVAVGKEHVCFATLDAGRVYCIGRNDRQQVGIANPEMLADLDAIGTWNEVPAIDPNLSVRRRFVELSAGLSFTCGRTDDNLVLCWGANYADQLGSGGGSTHMPRLIGWVGPLYSLASGNGHTCAAGEDDVICWGDNTLGQVADSPTDTLPPTAVGLNAKPFEVTTGWSHSCAIVDGQVICWGENDDGQVLGSVNGSDIVEPPTVVGLPTGTVSKIMASDDSTCVTIDGDLWCWGDSNYVGVANLQGVVPPTKTNLFGLEATAAYEIALYAILENGRTLAFGRNFPGVFGNGSVDDSDVPTSVANGLSFELIAAGGRNACGVASVDGRLRCWGGNDFQQLGAEVTDPQLNEPHLMKMPWESGD